MQKYAYGLSEVIVVVVKYLVVFSVGTITTKTECIAYSRLQNCCTPLYATAIYCHFTSILAILRREGRIR